MFLSFALLAFQPKLPTHTPAVRTELQLALKRYAIEERINTRQLRLIGKHLGTDISRANSEKLIDIYGYNGSMSPMDVEVLLNVSDTMSPSRYFWLKLDAHENGIRETRPRWNTFARSGMMTPTRIAHYGIGLLALMIGTIAVSYTHLTLPTTC